MGNAAKLLRFEAPEMFFDFQTSPDFPSARGWTYPLKDTDTTLKTLLDLWIVWPLHAESPLQWYYQLVNSTFDLFAYLSSLITSTKWASLFSLKFLARSWIRAEWSIPVPDAPAPPAMPRLVPVPVLVLVFFSFSWSMSHRELWLARTGSSSGGLRRPLAALGLWPGMNWMGRKSKDTKKQSGTGFRGWRRRRSRAKTTDTKREGQSRAS